MNTIYRIAGIITVWFFIAGIGLAAVYLILAALWHRVIKPGYKRSWLYYAIFDFTLWYKFEYKKEQVTIQSHRSLAEMKKNKWLARMPKIFSRRYYAMIEKRMKELREERLRYNEQVDF